MMSWGVLIGRLNSAWPAAFLVTGTGAHSRANSFFLLLLIFFYLWGGTVDFVIDIHDSPLVLVVFFFFFCLFFLQRIHCLRLSACFVSIVLGVVGHILFSCVLLSPIAISSHFKELLLDGVVRGSIFDWVIASILFVHVLIHLL